VAYMSGSAVIVSSLFFTAVTWLIIFYK